MNKISRQLQSDWPTHMSYDKNDGSVEKFYSSINGALVEKNSIFYNKRQIDIFLLAMAIGKKRDAKESIKTPSQSIRRDALNEQEVWLMCCVALSDNDAGLETLADPKKLIKTCEEYANGGIKILMQLDSQPDINNKQYEEFLEDGIKSHSGQP